MVNLIQKKNRIESKKNNNSENKKKIGLFRAKKQIRKQKKKQIREQKKKQIREQKKKNIKEQKKKQIRRKKRKQIREQKKRRKMNYIRNNKKGAQENPDSEYKEFTSLNNENDDQSESLLSLIEQGNQSEQQNRISSPYKETLNEQTNNKNDITKMLQEQNDQNQNQSNFRGIKKGLEKKTKKEEDKKPYPIEPNSNPENIKAEETNCEKIINEIKELKNFGKKNQDSTCAFDEKDSERSTKHNNFVHQQIFLKKICW